MKAEIKELNDKFLKIRKMGYVKGVGNGTFSCGDTFEQLLGKDRNELPYADYNGFEIKAKAAYSNQSFTLFCAEPDGKYLFSNINLIDKYGYKKQGKDFTFFFLDVTGNAKKRYVNNYFKLEVDRENREIVLNIYDLENNLIDNNTSWSFDLIGEKLKYKINNLALVRYFPSRRKDGTYFKYSNIQFYLHANFENFLKAIEDGQIHIVFSYTEHKVGPKKGTRQNHGTFFRILPIDVSLIYDEVYYK